MPIYDDDPVIFDVNGVQIERGMRTAAWSHGSISCPEGTVVALPGLDVDYNDDTGRPERFGPFVMVEYDDGTDERFDVQDARRFDWGFDYEWKCDEVEIIPGAHLGVRLPPAVKEPTPPSDGGGRAFALAHIYAAWCERNGFHKAAERLRTGYPF